MIPPLPTDTLPTDAALRQRLADPVHIAPGAQPIRGEVELRLTGKTATPTIVLTDRKRADITWRVEMTPDADQPGTWTAHVRLPSAPTMVYYHFEFADKTIFKELHQVERLKPASPLPIYGEWYRRPFQITVYDPASMPPAWTQGKVFYQIFPDRFAKSEHYTPTRERVVKDVHGRPIVHKKWDELPDHPPKSRDFFGGNLRGIIEQLDYLADLGVDCLYLTPIFESPSNHRYDACDYFQIDPLLGAEADLRELVEGVHQRGMRIILDAVFNHCSNDSLYFNAGGWYGADAGAAQSRQSPYFRWFAFNKWPKDYDGWIGVKSMPEFVECPEVEEFFLGADGVSNYWLRTGIDGWRTDVTPWVSDEFWRRMRRSVRATNPEALLIAEEWNDASHYLVGDSFDATMNYRFFWALRGFFAEQKLSLYEFDDRLASWRRDTPPPALLTQMNLIDSHDTARMLTLCGGDPKRFLQIVAFALAYPGAPMIFAGTEVGLEGEYAEAARRTFPWGGGDTALQDCFRRALAFRRASPALRLGALETVALDTERNVYGFARRLDGEAVYALFNAGDAPADVPLAWRADEIGPWRDVLGGHPPLEVAGGGTMVRLAPHSLAWYARG
jgi:glycosidase